MVKTGFAQFLPIFTPTVLRMTLTVPFLMIKAEELCMLAVASVLLKSILCLKITVFSHLWMKLDSLMNTNTVKPAFASFPPNFVLNHKAPPIE